MKIGLIKAILVAALATCVASAAAPAVQWMKTFAGASGAEGHCVQQTDDGGYVAVGETGADTTNGYRAYLVKIDSLGDTEWERTFSGAATIRAYSVLQTADGCYVVAGGGALLAGAAWRAFLMRIDGNGDLVWQKVVSDTVSSTGFSVVQTEDGGFAVAAVQDLSGDNGLLLIKTDSLGNGEWTKRYPVRYREYGPQNPAQLRQTSDGGFIIGTKGLLKVDSLGNQQWLRTYDGLRNAYSVLQTPDGGYVATGPGTDTAGEYRYICLLKTDCLGNTRWMRRYASSGYSMGNWVERTADGGYVIAGMTQPVNWTKACIIRTDSNGTAIWSDTSIFGGAACVRQTADEGHIVTGFYTDSSGQAQYAYLLKLAPEH